MKKYQLSFIFAGLITIFTACSKEPMDMAFIVNETDNPIMLYSDIDSLPVPPHKKIFYSGIVVEDEGIVSWSDIQYDFVGSRTLTKIGMPSCKHGHTYFAKVRTAHCFRAGSRSQSLSPKCEPLSVKFTLK